jgi:hypothetical protein
VEHTTKSGNVAAPTYSFNGNSKTGFHSSATDLLDDVINGAVVGQTGTNGEMMTALMLGTPVNGTVPNQGAATCLFKDNKKVTAIADATATAVLTVTIPNAAHSALLKLKYLGILGAGGAIGAGEAVAGGEVVICFTRTAGVASVINLATASGTCTAAVAGATTVTATIDNAAVAGANSAQQTFAIRITITKGGGASANHVALLDYELHNLNGTGITVA